MANLKPKVTSTMQLKREGVSTVPTSGERVFCAFVSNVGRTDPFECDSYADFEQNFINGEVDRNAHVSFLHAMKVTQNLPILAVRMVPMEYSAGIAFPSLTKVKIKGGKVMAETITAYLYISKKDSYAIQIGDIYFCSPDYNKTEADGIDASAARVEIDVEMGDSKEDNMTAFLDEVMEYINSSTSNVMGVSIKGIDTFTNVTVGQESGDESDHYCKIEIQSTEAGLKVQGPMVDPAKVTRVTTAGIEKDQFVVALTSPASLDTMTAQITKVEEKTVGTKKYPYFNITLNNPNLAESNSYSLSMNPTAVDGYGSDIYIESVNELRNDVVFIDLLSTAPDPLVATEEVSFGLVESEKFEGDAEIPTAMLNRALNKIDGLSSKRVSIMFDSGLAVPSYQSRLIMLAQSFKAIAVLSTPNYSATDSIVNYRRNMATDTTFAHFSAPWNKDKALCTFPVMLAAPAYYLERLGQNVAGNIRFAPIYAKSTGKTSAKNLTMNFKDSQIEQLLEVQINPIYYDENKKISTFINNLTATAEASDLQEEHIMRFVNMVRYDCDGLTEDYISYDWDEDTCDKIQDAIATYFTQSVKSLGRVPMDGDPIISATLNGRNKIKVTVDIRPKGSVKYINIYYNVISLA